MKTNNAGLELILHFENFRSTSYKCPSGVWTIGYGSTGKDIVEGMTWTDAQCEERFQRDLSRFEKAVEALVLVPVNENQFAALVSFAYNCGMHAFYSSTLLRCLNKGHPDDAAEEFKRWNKVTGRVLQGLTDRREAERRLFLTPVGHDG